MVSSITETNTKHQSNVDSMLVHRLQRWPNTEPTMVYRLAFAGLLGKSCYNIERTLRSPSCLIYIDVSF